jgi:uncharacterized protein YqhQ
VEKAVEEASRPKGLALAIGNTKGSMNYLYKSAKSVIPKPLKKNFLVRSFKSLLVSGQLQATVSPAIKNSPLSNDREETEDEEEEEETRRRLSYTLE